MFGIVTSQFICTAGITLAFIIIIKWVQSIYWLGIEKRKKDKKIKKKNEPIEKRKKKIKRNLLIDSCIQLCLPIFPSTIEKLRPEKTKTLVPSLTYLNGTFLLRISEFLTYVLKYILSKFYFPVSLEIISFNY